MKLLINASGNLYGGGLQVAISFIYECKKIKSNEYHVFLSPNAQLHVECSNFPENFQFYRIPRLPFYRRQKYLSELESHVKPEVVFTPFGPTYWRPHVPHITGFALGHYIYMDSPYFRIMSIQDKLKLKLKKAIHFYYLKKEADVFISETDDVTQRIKRIFGEEKSYYTVSNTCGSQYFSPISNKDIKRLPPKKEREIRLLTVCKYYPHKNIEIIKEVIDKLTADDKSNLLFVLTISTEEYQKIFGDKYKNNVTTVGTIPPQECPSLYRECDIMFLPTLVECFSASYVEAMVMEKPILTSDLGFAHSICEDAALYFDPLNAVSIIKQIKEIKSSITTQEQLIEKGKNRSKFFPSASQRAEQYLDICENILSKQHQ